MADEQDKQQKAINNNTSDALRPANQRGDTARRNEESQQRASEDSKDTIRPENQRADRNK